MPVSKAIEYTLSVLPKRVSKKIVDRALKALTDPIKAYNPQEITNVASLKKRLRVGDVLLVCGNARISYVVKVLTLSQWSHVVLYVGDRSDLMNKQEVDEWTAKYGANSLKHLVIDADPLRKVHLKPVDEYAGLMLRHCRPQALSHSDVDAVVDSALNQLGSKYDVKHIIHLLLFFAFPWELLPESLRRFVTDFTLSETDRICSRVLSEAFYSVGYPIRQSELVVAHGALHERALDLALGLKHRGKSVVRLLRGGRFKKALSRLSDRRYSLIHLRQSRHITPSDYDLSRYFSVIKDPQDLSFDYQSTSQACPLPPRSD